MLRSLTSHVLYLAHDEEYDRPLLAAVLGKERVLMVDAGASSRHAALFLDGLQKAAGRKPDLLVLTHWHWDHTYGLASYAAPAIGHRNLRENLGRLQGLSWEDEALDARVAAGEESPFCAKYLKKEYGAARDIRITLPTILLDGPIEIDLGGVTCVIQPLENDHTDDALVVFVREDRVLFAGDALYASSFALGNCYTAEKALALVHTLRGFGAQWCIISHETPKTWESVAPFLDRLEVLARAVAEGLRSPDALRKALQDKLGRAVTPEEAEEVKQFANGAERGPVK